MEWAEEWGDIGEDEKTPRPEVPLDGLLCLKLRNAIIDKEFCVASANNDIATYGKWQCDWSEGMREAEEEIQDIIKKLGT